MLEMLKAEAHLPKAQIEERMRAVVAQKGLEYRPQAVSYGLTALRKLGWATNVAGLWIVTERGMRGTLNEDDLSRLSRLMYP